MAEEYLTNNPSESLDKAIEELNPDKILVVTDTNVEKKVLPLFSDSSVARNPIIAISPGEVFKNLDTVKDIWDKLEEIGATRRSLIVNIGGGVVTDLGGFAASTFKRGIRTINLPTTLLGAVDAASGGKTGVNYNGLKNEIGTFHLPSKVIISTLPFATLSHEEILSGYAEMMKTAMIADRALYIRLLDMEAVMKDDETLGKAVAKCVSIKEEIVAMDPYEKGLRKILNFGHTAGHAFESLRIRLGQDVSHGKAVANGILVALILSHIKLGFSSLEVHYYSKFLKENYGPALIECSQVPEIIELMGADKKNQSYGHPLFTLLKEIGSPEINCTITSSEATEALEIYRDLLP